MVYTWSKELETGNSLIDSEHKTWINAYNNLMAACEQGKGRAAVQETLLFLQSYTAKHFSDEEALQKQYNYPGFAQHKQYHEAFRKTVADIVAEFNRTGPTIVLVGKINSQLGAWLINHIKREDKKVAEFIRK